MPKITFMGAGSTIFSKNVLGDCMLTPSLKNSEIALYDIDPQRLMSPGACWRLSTATWAGMPPSKRIAVLKTARKRCAGPSMP